MLTGLLHTHSLLRYLVLLFLLLVIINSFMGWMSKKPFTPRDNKTGLWLLILTHVQLLLGLGLYFASDMVQFHSGAMKDPVLRYWTVEHIVLMLVAVVLITVARISARRMTDDLARNKRLFLFNLFALLLVVLALVMSGRGVIIPNPR
jgi:cytochrome bd-type quinol oxidase subunit 2